MMQELVAGMERISLDSEADVEQLRAQPLPFPGVDSVQGHPRPGRTKPAVCKHWLRGLCKRGESCDFLHGYDASRVPECYFYSRFGECSNKDCPFLHAGATASTGRCPWYDRGFCWHGPLCKYKHMRRVMCANYLVGFCPEGPKCKFVHLKAGLMPSSTDPSKGAGCPWGLVQRDLAAAEDGGERISQTLCQPEQEDSAGNAAGKVTAVLHTAQERMRRMRRRTTHTMDTAPGQPAGSAQHSSQHRKHCMQCQSGPGTAGCSPGTAG
ncbi:putative cleavage and polyadenylation specificity factor subunit 4-like protein isoform X1 [Zonotrichia leucophrys gambelii]|uniref:putative cleavage and polyadenylation specificity factor subunit 4-like protein isoform X1 n=1 Tax=Zonotrichia leucophrys gambelii TaxID=257770 RepID=UPI003140920B